MTTVPVVTVAPAEGTVGVGAPHEGAPPAVGDAGAVAGDVAPAGALAAGPAVAAPVDPPVQGWMTGGAGVEVAGGAEVGGGVVAVAVPTVGAPAAGALVVVVVDDVVVTGAAAGGGVVAVVVAVVVVVVVVVADVGAADAVAEPAEACPTAVAAASALVTARHRAARSTERALTVTASRRLPNPIVGIR